MLDIHTCLMTHPTNNTFLTSNFINERILFLGQYCEDYFNNNAILNNIIKNNTFVSKFNISFMTKYCIKNASIQYRFYQS